MFDSLFGVMHSLFFFVSTFRTFESPSLRPQVPPITTMTKAVWAMAMMEWMMFLTKAMAMAKEMETATQPLICRLSKVMMMKQTRPMLPVSIGPCREPLRRQVGVGVGVGGAL
jgi:hypothetical protein